MRRPLIILPTLVALGALGCEDGPAQTYSPSPPGAGNIWNSGNPAELVADAGQSYDAGYPQTGKTTICSTDFKRDRWAWMLTQPIAPPRQYAGLDMALNDQWDGLTIDVAESAPATPTTAGPGLCQSIPFGFQGTCPSGYGGCNTNAWGYNNEVIFTWNIATHLVDQMELNLGYTGSMTTDKYMDHTGEMHSYTVTPGDIVRRDGQPFEIQWGDFSLGAKGALYPQITDIFNATMATFYKSGGFPWFSTLSPTSTPPFSCMDDTTCQGTGATANTTYACQCARDSSGKCTAAGSCGVADCGADGNCLIYNDGSSTIFGFRPLVIYVEGTAGVPQPAISTPQTIYNFFSKYEPYSNLPQVLKLDNEGPVAQAVPQGVGPSYTGNCSQKIGLTFGTLTTQCVEVTADTAVNTTNLNKITHSLTHDQEHWTANVLGVNQNFTSSKVAANPSIVVLDTDVPQAADIAQDFTFDTRARGNAVNESTPGTDIYTPGSGTTYAGTELLVIEWIRLMLEDMATTLGNTPTTIGDPTCIGFGAGGPNFLTNPACTGLEGIIIPNVVATPGGPGNFAGDPAIATSTDPALIANTNPVSNYDYTGGGLSTTLLKPGTSFVAFCVDPGGYSDCDYASNSAFQNALEHVIRVLGHGNINNVPSEFSDRRYYFKWFGVAYIKYLKAFGNYLAKYGTATMNFPTGAVGTGLAPSDVHNQQIDLESLFFDYTVSPGVGAAQTFDKFEYIDRDFIVKGATDTTGLPWDFEYGTDLFGGNQRYDNWYRRMDREEIGMYSAMLTNKADNPGTENNVNITNLFGSTLLGGNAEAGTSGIWPTWAAATGQVDPAAAGNGFGPPLDPAQPNNDPCLPDGSCKDTTKTCLPAQTYEQGTIQACVAACGTITATNLTGCPLPSQACAGLGAYGYPEGCFDMKMDKNGANAANPHPLLWNYPGVWQRTPFSRGHSPITLAAADKHPDIGVAKISIPNFVVDSANPYTTGPYTNSPILPSAGTCPTGYTLSSNKAWCNAAVLSGSGTSASAFTPLTPWFEVQPAIGFPIPLDAQHNQWIATGQLDFTGVLESYIVDYVPYVDIAKASCVSDGVCNTGFTCDSASHNCITNDNTLQIEGIEGADFLGQAFLCQDAATGDILHAGMYDSADVIVDWLAAHPGTNSGTSAQNACQILVIRSPYDNYVDYIVSKGYGVTLNMGGGQGQGRVTDIVLWDTSLIQSL